MKLRPMNWRWIWLVPSQICVDLGVAEQALDAEILAIAVAAEELHRVGRDAHREVGGAQLEDRGLDREIRGAAIDEPPDMPQPRLGQRQVGGHVGEHELDALELDDAAAATGGAR